MAAESADRREHLSGIEIHFDGQWLADNHIVSAAVLSLIFQEELLGVLAAFFTEEMPLEASEVLSALASVTSSSLENLRAMGGRDAAESAGAPGIDGEKR